MDCISFKENNMDNFKNYICKFEDNKLLSSFLLKTDSNTIHSIKNSMTISLKNISYFSNNKTALLLLFKFADNDKLIYGKWFNYSNNADKEHLEMMLFQKEIPILLIDSKTNEQFTFYVTNDFSSGIKEHIKKTNSIKMSDFDFNSYITYLERNIKSLPKLWYSIDAWKRSCNFTASFSYKFFYRLFLDTIGTCISVSHSSGSSLFHIPSI